MDELDLALAKTWNNMSKEQRESIITRGRSWIPSDLYYAERDWDELSTLLKAQLSNLMDYVVIKASKDRCNEIDGLYLENSKCKVFTGNELPAVMQSEDVYKPLILELGGENEKRISAEIEIFFDSPEEALEEAVVQIRKTYE